MRSGSVLVTVSAIVFAITGLGYLLVPGPMLAVVGVPSTPTSDFLLRIEGVALLFGAGVLWGVRNAGARPMTVALLSLAFYFVVGTLVDLAAYGQGIVSIASVPSAAVRIALGIACLAVAARVSRSAGGSSV